MQPAISETPLLVISGPTASGKTSVALDLARRLNGEIISADSMQVYKHLSIGTAKPTAEELDGQPYHLIDHVEPGDQYHLGRFVTEATELIDKIRSSGKQPIVCGGTGLYIKGMLYGVFSNGEAAPEVREQLEQRRHDEGLSSLYSELEQVDPALASLYGPNDRQRIIRALEVYHSTGKPLSSMHQQNLEKPLHEHRLYVLSRPRPQLYDRINNRVELMVQEGLRDEVRTYLAGGWSHDNPAIKALGYRELIAAEKGELPLEAALQAMKQKSRNYAKRQETWFRSMKNSIWINCEELSATQITDTILADWKN